MSDVPNYNPTGDYKNDLALLRAQFAALKAALEALEKRIAALEHP